MPGRSGESTLLALEERGVVVSSGSACAAGRDDPSPTLLALGLAPEVAQTAVRFSFGEVRRRRRRSTRRARSRPSSTGREPPRLRSVSIGFTTIGNVGGAWHCSPVRTRIGPATRVDAAPSADPHPALIRTQR
ncbi:Cysteine desulfurase [Rathayibacter tanaceti]|uniref:Cysteine desulfurase n=1 Tax=Rathayibacter tanaceti TaxID=1671680 RepID=A0A162FUX2_9MICO|nr:Cysteine desulfurase [Rathayibacter tanaceti]